MKPDTVTLDVSGGVATITLNRPSESNALDLTTVQAFRACVRSVGQREDVTALVLAGAGRVFCAGGDLAGMDSASDRRGYLAELAQTMHDAVLELDQFHVPVVAAVRGAAAGAGLSLVLAADLVVAGESSRFLTAYLSAGLTPDCGLSALLPRIVGLRRALELTLTARVLTVAEAIDWGIVSSCVPDTQVDDAAQAMARMFDDATHPAAGWTRGLLRSSSGRTLEAQLDLEARTIAEAAGTAASTALIDAFLTKHQKRGGA